MKFPLPSSPFAPLNFTSEEKETFQRMVQSILDQAIQEYFAHGITSYPVAEDAKHPSTLKQFLRGHGLGKDQDQDNANGNHMKHKNKQQPRNNDWKVVLKQESVTILKQRTKPIDDPVKRVHFHAFGTIPGPLDDVLYGLVGQSPASMRIRSSYVADNVVDSRLLYELESPSLDKPFHFLGIQWLVKLSPPGFVKPRDFVVLKYFGDTTVPIPSLPDGRVQRFGFYILHSLELRQVPSLEKTHGICRGQISACHLYAPDGQDPLQVHFSMHSHVDPSGSAKILDSIVTHSAINGMMSCFQATYCAQMKKLAFCVQQRTRHEKQWLQTISDQELIKSVVVIHAPGRTNATDRNQVQQVQQLQHQHPTGVSSTSCGCCHQPFFALSSKHWCRICAQQICKKCCVTKRLSFDTGKNSIHQQKLRFCHACITHTKAQSALAIARAEIQLQTQETGSTHSSLRVPSCGSQASSSSSSSSSSEYSIASIQQNEYNTNTNNSSSSMGSSRSVELHDAEEEEIAEDEEEVEVDTASMRKVKLHSVHPNGLVGLCDPRIMSGSTTNSCLSSSMGSSSTTTGTASQSQSQSQSPNLGAGLNTSTSITSMEDMYVQITKLLQTTEKTIEVLNQTTSQMEETGQFR